MKLQHIKIKIHCFKNRTILSIKKNSTANKNVGNGILEILHLYFKGFE